MWVEESYIVIVIVYYLNDLIEIFFYNFIKGIGLVGFRGILIWNGFIICFILFVKKIEILVYVGEEKFLYREDSFNVIDKYFCNKIRYYFFFKMKEINLVLEEIVVRNFSILYEFYFFY